MPDEINPLRERLEDPTADLMFGPADVAEIATLWTKAIIIEGVNRDVERMDQFGNRIRYRQYGNRQSDFGWERHHVVSVADGGGDDIDNLIPLQWRQNVALGG